MRNMNKNQINQILKQHHRFLRTNGAEGERANLRDADLAGADLTGADLTGADLRDADLTGADLGGASLTGADLDGAILAGANLEGANLTCANLDGASLTGANLTGTILEKKEAVSSNPDLRAKFDEFAKSLGLEIVSLKVKRSETINL